MIRKRLLSLALFAAAYLTLTLAAGAGPLQLESELSDAEFWRLLTEFSEDDGYFRFENFLSNELEYQTVIPALRERTKPGGVYLGVGPEQNFTYIVALQPRIAFIFDIRRQNLLELLMYKALFEMSSDRADFVSRLFARPRPDGLSRESSVTDIFSAFAPVERDAILFTTTMHEIRKRLLESHGFKLSADDIATIDYVYEVFVQSGPEIDYTTGGGARGSTYAELMTATDDDGLMLGFLASESNFQYVQTLQRKNLIVPLVGDFAGAKAIRSVAQYLKERNALVSVFYVSNVEQYLFQQDDDWARFYDNVGRLPLDSTSQFIRTSRFAFPVGPRQLPREPTRGNFLTLIAPMSDLIQAYQEGHLESYNQVIQMSR